MKDVGVESVFPRDKNPINCRYQGFSACSRASEGRLDKVQNPLHYTNISKDDFSPDNVLYRTLKFLGYDLNITDDAKDREGKPTQSGLAVTAGDSESLSKIAKITGFMMENDLEYIFMYLNWNRPERIYDYLQDPQNFILSLTNFRSLFVLNTPPYQGVTERCYMTAFERYQTISLKFKTEMSYPYPQLYEELTSQAIQPMNPEDMGLLYAGLIRKYQEEHPEVLPKSK